MEIRKVKSEYRMAQWTQIIQERRISGESVKAFCLSRGISKDAYFYWQKKLRESAYEQMTAMHGEPAPETGLVSVGFAEVKLLDNQGRRPQREAEGRGSLVAEVTGVKIVTDAAYPVDRLAYLLRELVRSC